MQGPHSKTNYVEPMPHKPKHPCKPVIVRTARRLGGALEGVLDEGGGDDVHDGDDDKGPPP